MPELRLRGTRGTWATGTAEHASRLLGSAALLLLVGLLGACSNKPRPPPEVRLTIDAVATDTINPDRSGRASPVAVTIFQLKNADAFRNADFFALANSASAVLGPNSLAREEITLRPGEERTLPVKLEPGTSHIGVIAAFRDIEHASWRAELELPKPSEKQKKALEVRFVVRVDALGVSLNSAGA